MLRFAAAALVLACLSAPAPADECMKATDYAQLRQRYADLSARFDLASLAQQMVDAASAAGDARAALAACRRNATEGGGDCASLAAQLAAKEAESAAVQERLATAIDMDEYLATLKLRLERPPCAE